MVISESDDAAWAGGRADQAAELSAVGDHRQPVVGGLGDRLNEDVGGGVAVGIRLEQVPGLRSGGAVVDLP